MSTESEIRKIKPIILLFSPGTERQGVVARGVDRIRYPGMPEGSFMAEIHVRWKKQPDHTKWRPNTTGAGSLTAEAAFTVPIIFFAWLIFLNFFQVIRIQEELHYAASEAVQSAAALGRLIRKAGSAQEEYLEKELGDSEYAGIEKTVLNLIIKKVSAEVFYRTLMEESISTESLEHSCIKGGGSGIRFDGSSLLNGEACAEIVLSYQIQFPASILPGLVLPVTQKVRMRSFIGEGEIGEEPGDEEGEESQEGEGLAYLTENGRVYHTDRGCSYIKVSVKVKKYQEIESLRNESGGKYTGCLYCGRDLNAEDLVYIAKYGDVYHTTVTCSRIQRKVKTMPISEAEQKYPQCSKCAKKEGKEN